MRVLGGGGGGGGGGGVPGTLEGGPVLREVARRGATGCFLTPVCSYMRLFAVEEHYSPEQYLDLHLGGSRAQPTWGWSCLGGWGGGGGEDGCLRGADQMARMILAVREEIHCVCVQLYWDVAPLPSLLTDMLIPALVGLGLLTSSSDVHQAVLNIYHKVGTLPACNHPSLVPLRLVTNDSSTSRT